MDDQKPSTSKSASRVDKVATELEGRLTVSQSSGEATTKPRGKKSKKKKSTAPENLPDLGEVDDQKPSTSKSASGVDKVATELEGGLTVSQSVGEATKKSSGKKSKKKKSTAPESLLDLGEVDDQKPSTSKSASGVDKFAAKMEVRKIKQFEIEDRLSQFFGKATKKPENLLDLGEKIISDAFRYLELGELVHVAQTCHFLKKCVDETIKEHFKTGINNVQMQGPNSRFFSNFGHLARGLEANCGLVPKSLWKEKNLHILPVIAKKTTDDLKSLRLNSVGEILTTLSKGDQDKVRQLFSKLDKLYIKDCCLVGWDKLMKSADIKLYHLSLEYAKSDTFHEFIRRYQGLKSLHVEAIFPIELFDANENIHTFSIVDESISNSKVKYIRNMPKLRNLCVDVSGQTEHIEILQTDFSVLAKIQNLHYFYFITSSHHHMKMNAYISMLKEFKRHKKLTEFHWFPHYTGLIDENPNIFAANAFSNLKQMSVYHNFPYLNAMPKIESLNDIYIMVDGDEESTVTVDYNHFRPIIIDTPNLKRLIFNHYAVASENDIALLTEICKARTSESELMVMFQVLTNTVVKAVALPPNTVLIYSFIDPKMQKKTPPKRPPKTLPNKFVFDDSISSAYERAQIIADDGGCVAINYIDFAFGINTIENL